MGHDIRDQAEVVSVRYGETTSMGSIGPAIWVLSGTHPAVLPAGASLKIYNMVATPEFLIWLNQQAVRPVEITLSDSLCRELGCEAWLDWADRNAANVRIMGGTGLYVPNWMPVSDPGE